MCPSHTIEYYSDTKKEWSIDACYSMDEPRKHDVEWKKPDAKGKYAMIIEQNTLEIFSMFTFKNGLWDIIQFQ